MNTMEEAKRRFVDWLAAGALCSQLPQEVRRPLRACRDPLPTGTLGRVGRQDVSGEAYADVLAEFEECEDECASRTGSDA